MATDQQIQTVEIPEPSDKHEVAHDEKPCFTKRHLYIAIGVVFVVAISLIGSLLDFSPSDDGINEQSIAEGTQATWPQFDTNGDGFVDKAEYTQWAATRIAARKRFCTAQDPEPVQTVTSSDVACNGTCPTALEVEQQFNPIDTNRDGKISLQEAIAYAIMLLKKYLQNKGMSAPNTISTQGAPTTNTPSSCPVPSLPGFAGRVSGGWVGACQPGFAISCSSSEFCQDKKKCHKNAIEISWTTTDTCCGGDQAANCTQCNCGGSYRFVPHGHHARARSMCHWLSTYHCGDVDTKVPVW
jgi:hypothetical protein